MMDERRNTMRALGRGVRRAALGLSVLVLTWSAALSLPVELGVHGGLTIPNIHGTTEMSRAYESRRGPFFGLTAAVRLSSHLWLCTELDYSSQGGQRLGMQPIPADQMSGLPVPPGMPLYAGFHNETILDYLELPLLVRLMSGGRYRFYVEAGPYAALRVRSVTETSGSSLIFMDSAGTLPIMPVQMDFSGHTDISRDVRDFNAGVAGGAGVETALGPGNVVLGVRLALGLVNIQPESAGNGDNRTGAVILMAGYRLTL
jgi:hypothetical protein